MNTKYKDIHYKRLATSQPINEKIYKLRLYAYHYAYIFINCDIRDKNVINVTEDITENKRSGLRTIFITIEYEM